MRLRIPVLIFLLVSSVIFLTLNDTLHAFENQIERISVSSTSVEGNDVSNSTSMSADGRFVVFTSDASNLVADDTNNVTDVFVRDRETGTTERISVSSTGQQGNLHSTSYGRQSISGDGLYVVFSSAANNLVSGDTNGSNYDVFVRDRQTGETTRVSIATSGQQGNLNSFAEGISADGRYVAFTSSSTTLVLDDTNGQEDVFVHDRQTGETQRVSVSSFGQQANGGSNGQQISADGQHIVFQSQATNLAVDDTNDAGDVYVHSLQTGQTWRVSVSSTGAQGIDGSFGPAISGNGRFVTFTSPATNLVTGDTNANYDAFVHDIQTSETFRISVSSSGVQGNNYSEAASLSNDGRFVSFSSDATNLVENDTNTSMDVFVHDRQTGETVRVSTSGVEEGNGISNAGKLNENGKFITFTSFASNLVLDDFNGKQDVFLAQNPLFLACPPITVITTLNIPSHHHYVALPLTLTWNRVSWASFYEVQVYPNSTFTGTPAYTAIVPKTILEVTINDLCDGTYYWHVRAQNSNGDWTEWSARQVFTLDVP